MLRSVIASTVGRRAFSASPIQTLLYTSPQVKTTGGRDGHAIAEDKSFETKLSKPAALGGTDGAVNPEILFAAGYSACFEGAMGLAVKQHGLDTLPAGTSVTGSVDLGKDAAEKLTLAATLRVELPGVEKDLAKQIVETAHTICPYSNATRGNIVVNLEVV